MKPLFLFLAILLAIEPVVSVSCWMNGQCRLVCNDDEENVIRCPNRKRCCFVQTTQENKAVFRAVRSEDAVFCKARCRSRGRSEEFTPTCADNLPSGKRHILRCMGDKGICRTSCKKTENPYLYCRDYRPCCLQSYMRINMFSTEDNSDWR